MGYLCVLLISISSVLADDWSHQYFISNSETGNVKISLDYIIDRNEDVNGQILNMRMYAANIWINVQAGKHITSSDVVEAYLVREGGQRSIYNQSIFLEYDANDNRFTGKFQNVLFSEQICPAVYASYNNRWYCEGGWRYDDSLISNAKVAIRINNSWSLVDPQSGSHDFSFVFMK